MGHVMMVMMIGVVMTSFTARTTVQNTLKQWVVSNAQKTKTSCSAFTPQVAAILTRPRTTRARTNATSTPNATAIVPALAMAGAREVATVLL